MASRSKYGSKGSHTGSLAGGFINGLLAALKYGMIAQHYAAQEKYWDWLMKNKGGVDPGAQKAYDTGAGRDIDRGGDGDRATTTSGAPGGRWAPEGYTAKDVQDYIRASATARGIDPDVAVKVAHSEWGNTYTGDNGKSFGPFQLFTGGGLGNVFEKETGLKLSDQSTWKQQIDFALDHAATDGWGPWHGARNAGIANNAGLANAKPLGATAYGKSQPVGKPETKPAATQPEKPAPTPVKTPAPDKPAPTPTATSATALRDRLAGTVLAGPVPTPDTKPAAITLDDGTKVDPNDAAAVGKLTSDQQEELKWKQRTAPTATAPTTLTTPTGVVTLSDGTKIDPADPDAMAKLSPDQKAEVSQKQIAALPSKTQPTAERPTPAEQAAKPIAVAGGIPATPGTPATPTTPPPPPTATAAPATPKPAIPTLPDAAYRAVGGGGREGSGSAGAYYGPAPTPSPPPAQPQLVQAPIPPRRPADLGTSTAQVNPPVPQTPSTPSPAEPQPTTMTASGYGPNGKWTNNPPLAERKPTQVADASITPPSNPPGMPPDPGSDPTMSDPTDMMLQQEMLAGDASSGVGDVSGAFMRRGGPVRGTVRRYWRGGPIRRYQDGGDVLDPGASATGMPPALGGGQQQIPPIYFNPATYAAAGAPVGKGISATSAPTFTAGAIPTLPMWRGGTVKRYQGGGGIDDFGGDVPDTSYGDMAITSDLERRGESTAEPDPLAGLQRVDDTTGGQPIQLASNIGGFSGVGSLGGGMPTPRISSGPRGPTGTGGRTAGPKGLGFEPIDQDDVSHPDHPANHPDLPPGTPQVMDQDGNPSNGLIGAIASGLHHIAQSLGLAPDQKSGAIASDPTIQANRREHMAGGVAGTESWSPEQKQELDNIVDPNKKLDNAMRNIAGLEAVYEYYRDKGDPVSASKVAASLLQASVQASMNYGDQAVQRYYHGDLQGSIDALALAKEQIADGTILHGQIVTDANGQEAVEISGHKLNGEELWRRVVAPQEILRASIRAKNGAAAWDLYEQAAGKYDPGYADKQRVRRETFQQSEAERKQKVKDDAAAAEELKVDKALQGGGGDWGEPLPTETIKPVETPHLQEVPKAPVKPEAQAEPPVVPTDTGAMVAGPGIPPSVMRPSPTVAAGDTQQPTTASADSTGTAASPVRPAGADTTGIPPAPAGARVAQAAPAAPAEAQVIPESKTPAQPVSLDDAAAADYQKISGAYDTAWSQANAATQAKYIAPDGRIIYQGRMYGPPPQPQMTGDPKVNAALRQRFTEQNTQYNDMVRNINERMGKELGFVKDALDKKFGALLDERKAYWADQRQLRGSALTEKRTQESLMDPNIEREMFKETPQVDVLAKTPHIDVPETADPAIDLKMRRQALGRMFDIPDDSGKAQGGAARVARLGDTLWDIQGTNKHASKEQIGDAIVGLARGSYSYEAPKESDFVNRGGAMVAPIKVWYGPKGKSPSATLYVSPDSWDAIMSVRSDMANAPKPSPSYMEHAFPPAGTAIPPGTEFPWYGPGATFGGP